MILYVLPSIGRFGGVKVGFQFAELLRSCGVPVVMATPGGAAPDWFRCSVPVVPRESAIDRLGIGDVAIFSLPHDFDELRATGARSVFHCQGTDPLIDPIIADDGVVTLTCWDQAHRHVTERTGREPIDVGISVSDVFGTVAIDRRPRSIAYMPRRGLIDPIADHARSRGIELIAIDGDDERMVAAKMAAAEVFVAVSEGEWFGLPALEAMASGCAVVSVPVLGGMEFLIDGHTAMVRPIEEFGGVLDELLGIDGGSIRHELVRAGGSIIGRYRRAVHRRRVVDALSGPLGKILR